MNVNLFAASFNVFNLRVPSLNRNHLLTAYKRSRIKHVNVLFFVWLYVSIMLVGEGFLNAVVDQITTSALRAQHIKGISSSNSS